MILNFASPVGIKPYGRAVALRLVGFVLAFGVVLAPIVPVNAQVPVIELRAVQPWGASIGSTIDLKLASGTYLDEADRLIFSHPGITATVKTADPLPFTDARLPSNGQFSVTVAGDVPEGIYEVRTVGRFGVSNPRPFLVTRAPQQLNAADHFTKETAVALTSGSWNHATFRAQQRNQYRIHVEPNDSLVLVCLAATFDSRATPVMTLSKTSGREVAKSRSIGMIPNLLVHHAGQSEDLVLTIHDALFRGGDEFAYTVAHFPDPGDGTAVNGFLQACRCTNPASLGLAKWTAAGNMVNRDEASPCMALTVPCVVQGHFEKEHDNDCFEFQAKASETYFCDVLSEGIDQTTDPRMIVEKVSKEADGKEKIERVLVQDDQPAIGLPGMQIGGRDPRARFQAAQDGTYRIRLANLQNGRSSSWSDRYLMRLTAMQPDFDAIAYWPIPTNNIAQQARPAGALLARGGTISLRVAVKRSGGFDGPVSIRVDGLPAGVTQRPTIMHATQNETEVILAASEDAAAWVGPLSVNVVAKVGEQELTQMAECGSVRFAASPERGLPIGELNEKKGLWMAVSDQELAPLQIHATDGNPIEVAKGAKVALPIRAIRRAGGADKCILRPQNLPPKSALGETAIEGNASEANPEIQIAADTPVGEYTFWFQTETKFKMRVNPQALTRAEAYRAALQTIFDDPNRAAEKPAVEMAIKTADQRIEQLKKETAERDIQVFVPTTSVLLKVVEPK